MERSERLRGNRQTGVDEESLDSGHTPGIDERGKSRTAALEIRLEAGVMVARHMGTCRGSGT